MGPGTVSKPSPESQAAAAHLAALRAAEEARRRAEEAARRAAEEARRKAEEARRQAEAARREAEQAKKAADDAARVEKKDEKDDKQLQQLRDTAKAKETEALKKEAKANLAEKEQALADSKLQDAQQGHKPGAPSEGTQAAQKEVDLAKKVVALYEAPEQKGDQALDGASARTKDLQTKAQEAAKPAFDAMVRGEQPTQEQKDKANKALGEWLDAAQQEMRTAGVTAQAKGGDANAAIDKQAADIRKRLEEGGVFDPKAFDESLGAAKAEVKGESPAARQLRMEQYDARKTAQADYDKARQDAKTADEKADAAEAYAKNFTSASTDSQVTAQQDARAEAKRLRKAADEAQAKTDRLKLQGDATDSEYESDIADIKVRDAQAGYVKAQASGDKDAIAKAEKLLDGAIDEQTLAHDLRDDASAKLELFDAKGNLADAKAAWEAEKGNQPQLKEVEYNHRGTKTTRTITPDGYDKTFWATPGTDAGKNVQQIDGKWYYVTSGPRGTQSKQELNPVTAQLWEAHVGVNGEQKDGKTVGGAQLAADQAQAKLKLTLEDMFGTGDGQSPGRLDSQAWLGAEGDINKKLTDANDGVTAAQSALTAARRYGASADTIADLEADLGGKLQLQRQAQGMVDALKAIKDLRQAQRELAEIQNPGSANRCPTMTEAQARQRVNDLRDKARTAVTNALKPPEFSPEQVKAARTRLDGNQKLLKTQEQTVETARTEWQNATGDDKVKKDQAYQAALDKYDQLKLAVDNDQSLVKQADTRYRADAAQNQYDNFGFVKPKEGYTRGGYNFASNLKDQPDGFDPTYDVKPPSNYDELLRTAKKEDDGTRVLSDGTKIKPDGTWELKDGTQIEHKDGKYYVSFKTYVAAGRAGMVASRSDKFEMHGVTAKLWDTKRLAYEADVGRTKFLDDLKLKGQTLPPAEPQPPVLGLDGKPRPTLLLTDDLAKRKPQMDKALTDATDARKLAQQNYDQGTGDRTELKTKLDDAIALEDIARKEQAAVDAVLLWQSSNRERQEYDANKRAGRPDAMCYAKPPGETADDQRDLALKAIKDWQGARDKLHTDRAQRKVDSAQTAHDTWKRENPWLAGSEKSSDTWKALQQAKGDYDLVKRGQAANAGARADEQAFISQNLKPGEHNDPGALYRLFDSNPQVMAQAVINDHYVQYGGEAITMQGRTHLGNLVSQALGWQPSVELDPNSPAYNQQLTKTQDLYGNLVKEQKELRGNVVDKIVELGGDDAKVTVLPVVYGLDEKNGGIVKTAIFKVEGDNGQVRYVDEQGWEYKSLDDYRANNSLPVEDVKLVMPEDGKFTLDDKGNVKLLVADARTETGWETFRRVSKIDYVVAGVGLVAGVVLTVGSMGTLSVPGAAIAVASVSLVAAGTYGVVTSAQSLQRQADHGQSVNPFTNAQARMDWLNLGLSALSVPVVGASGRATMLALRSKAAFDRVGDVTDVTKLTVQQASDLQQGIAYAQRAAAWGKPAQAAAKPLAVGSGVAMEEGVRHLVQNWDNMSSSERNQQIAMLGLNAAGFASPVFAKGYTRVHVGLRDGWSNAGSGSVNNTGAPGTQPRTTTVGATDEGGVVVPLGGRKPGTVPHDGDGSPVVQPAEGGKPPLVQVSDGNGNGHGNVGADGGNPLQPFRPPAATRPPAVARSHVDAPDAPLAQVMQLNTLRNGGTDPAGTGSGSRSGMVLPGRLPNSRNGNTPDLQPAANAPFKRTPHRTALERQRAAGTQGEGAKPWRITHGDEHPLASDVNPTRSDTNCVNSAVTLDRMMSSPGAELQAVPSGAKTLAQVFALYGDAPTAAFNSSGDALARIAALPEGTRGFITMGGGDGADLHIVNFVRQGKGVDVVDAQAGRYVKGFDASDVHVIVTHEGGKPPVDMTVMSGPQLGRFLATSPHDAPAQGPQGLVSGLPSNAGKPGFDANGDALPPTSFGRRRNTWEEVARGADGYIQRQQLAARPGSKVTPLQTSADEAAVLKSLTDEPEIHSRVKFVVSKVGPYDTIFGGAGVKGRKLYETYAAAAKAAEESGGGWVHRMVPDGAKGAPRNRRQFDSSEIVGAVHVGRDGTQLPIGIPNTRHGSDLGRATEVAASWKEAVKGVLTHKPTDRNSGDNKQIRAKVFTYGAAGARIAAEGVASFFSWPANILKHPGAGYTTYPLSSFGRSAYLTASQRTKEAFAAATTGNLNLAEKLLGKVVKGSGWRGDNQMKRAKIDELYTDVWKVQEAGEVFRQKLEAMGADAPPAKQFRLDTIQHPDEVALAPKSYLDAPGVSDFIQMVRYRQRDGMFGEKTRVVRHELLRRLSNMDRNELARAADPASKDNSPEARLLRQYPEVRKAFERRVDERQDLRRAHGDLYKALLEVAADPEKPGYVSAQAAEGNAGSTNAPSSRLGLISRRATLVASTNVFVGWFFKPVRISSATTGVAHFADFLSIGSLWANYKYNIKVDNLANAKAKLEAAVKASGLSEKRTRAADPALDKEVTNAQLDKDKWNKWRDYFGIVSAGRAVAVGVGLQEVGLHALGYASYTQAGLTLAWVGLQQIPALRNGAAPNLTKWMKWGAVGSIALVPAGTAFYNAFFAPKKDDNAKNLVEWTIWGLKQPVGWVKDWLHQPADQVPAPGTSGNPPVTTGPSVTPSPSVTSGPSASPTQRPSATPTPGTSTRPPGSDPDDPGLPPDRDPLPPALQPIYVTVDGSNAKTATLWGISEHNVTTLLAGPALDKAKQEGGRNHVVSEALTQLFNLNPRFDKRLMDGVVTNIEGDPDTLVDGWKVKVGERMA
jgi:hypothetical protein